MNDFEAVNKFPDIKAEILLVELLSNDNCNRNIDNLRIYPIGSFNKDVSADLCKISENSAEHETSILQADTRRNGIYDALPHGLVHTSTVESELSSVQKIKQSRLEEQNARKFLKPFDYAINHQRLLLEQEERKIFTGFPDDSRHLLFDMMWESARHDFTDYQKSLLFSILPNSHTIIGNLDMTASVMSTMIGNTVRIQKSRTTKDHVADNVSTTLGSLVLAETSALAITSEIVEDVYEIMVSDIPGEESELFLPRGQKTKALELLSQYLLPMEYDFILTLDVDKTPLELKEIPDNTTNILGYTITL